MSYVFSFRGGKSDATNLISTFEGSNAASCFTNCNAVASCVNFLMGVSNGKCELYSDIRINDSNT